jgi:hypothetical protein
MLMRQINELKKQKSTFSALNTNEVSEAVCNTEVTTISDYFHLPVSQNVYKITVYTIIYQVFNLFWRKPQLYPDTMENKGGF